MAEKLANEINDNATHNITLKNSPDRINENSKCEYLSNDILDEDFLKVFSSLHKAKVVFGVNRVDARDLFISSLTLNLKIRTLVQSFAQLAALFTANFLLVTNLFSYDFRYLAGEMAASTGLNHLSTVLFARFFHNDRNVNFKLKIQEIDRQMGVARNKQINEILRKIIRLNVAVLGALYVILLLLSFYGGFYLMATIALTVWCLGASVLELTHCSVLLVYFLIRVRFINSVMLNHIEEAPSAELPRMVISPTTAVLRVLAGQAHDFRTMDTDVHLKLLFECFIELQELFKFPVAVLFITYFSYFWNCVQFAIFGLKNNAFSAIEWALLPLMLYFGLILSLVLTYRFEKFFREVRETKRLAIVLMSRYHDGPLWEKARRMYSLVENSPPRFSVYDMWQLNAVFLIQFFKAVTTMIVTELQFGL